MFGSNYNNQMNQKDIQKVANQACFSTNNQNKQQAQQMFLSFCSQLRPSDYESLLQTYSQTTVFVLMEYTYKKLQIVAQSNTGTNNNSYTNQIKAYYYVISNLLLSWSTECGSFVRPIDRQNAQNTPNTLQLPKYIERSIGRTVGQALKLLFINKDIKNEVLLIIKQQTNQRFRLYLWKVFLQTVSEIDTRIGFISYRNLVYCFQEDIIPIIIEDLMPFFLSVKSTVQINILSAQISRTSVSQLPSNKSKQGFMLFSPQQKTFSTLIFDVLKGIICFTYNITYSEYDMENHFEYSLICFPEKVTEKIVSKDFVESIFFLTSKLITEMPKSDFMDISLDCLNKILLCRLTYIDRDTVNTFIQTCIIGLNKLFTNANLNQKILVKLLDANIKFLNNIDMHKLRKFEPQFSNWLGFIRNICLTVCSSMRLNHQNQVLKHAFQLVTKILGNSISPKLQQYRKHFQLLSKDILESFVNHFFSNNHNIMGDLTIQKVKQLKKISDLFFAPIKTFIGVDFKQNFLFLQQVCNVVFGSQKQLIRSANLLLLIGEIIESNFLQRNIFYENPKQQQIQGIGKIMHKALVFIQLYQSQQVAKKEEFLDISIMIFMEKAIIESQKGIQWKQQRLNCSAVMYIHLKNQMKVENDEIFLIQCFKLVIKGLQSTQKERVQFAMEVISTQLMKFKWTLRRDNFKCTQLSKQMLKFCIQTSRTSLKGNLLKMRKKLFEIISLISFDDVMDSFKQNIDGIILQQAQKMLTNTQQVIFDITGIVNTIDTSNIYKYFLTEFQKKIGMQNFMNLLFKKFSNQQTVLKAILKLHLGLVENRSQRLASSKSNGKAYELMLILMPYWNQILQVAKRQDVQNIIHQLHKIFRAIAKGGHINFGLLQNLVPADFEKYLVLSFKSMVNVTPWIQQYPKHYDLLIEIGLIIVRDLSKIITTMKNNQILESFSCLISFFLSQNMKLMKQLAQGNRKSESQLEKIFDICRNFFVEMKGFLKFEHRVLQVKNINCLLQDRLQQKQKYMIELFQFCLGNGRAYSAIVRNVYAQIQQLSILYNGSYLNVMQSLGIDEERVKSLQKIWRNQTSKQQFGVGSGDELFISNLKDWFRMCDTDYIVEIDY